MNNPAAVSLFDQASSTSGAEGRVYFLTNRYNLLQILSSGLVGPRSSYDKYYGDLLDLCPGRIPLLTAPIGSREQALVMEDDETCFPVAVEFDVDRLRELIAPALTSSGGSERHRLGEATVIAWAPGGVIPLALARRVVFRGDRELREHSARKYENIPPHAVDASVDARVFGGSASGPDVGAWLRGLSPIDAPTPEGWNIADRRAGARCLAVQEVARAAGMAASVARLLEPPSINTGKKREKKSKVDLGTAPWLSTANIAATKAAGGDLEERLFTAAARTLMETSRATSWRPLEILTTVEARVREAKLSKKEEGELVRNLESARLILRNERDFRPFKPGVGLSVAKALLLVLLRPDPAKLARWTMEETGADEAVVVTAAVFAGLLAGRTRLPTELRPPSVDSALARLAAQELTADVQDAWSPSTGVPALSEEQGSNGESLTVLRLGHETLCTWQAAPRSLASVVESVDFETAEGAQLGLRMAELLSWGDCVRASIAIDRGEFGCLRGKGKGLTITTTGWPRVSVALDQGAFRARLSKDGIPADAEQAVRELLGTVAGADPQTPERVPEGSGS